MKRKIILSLCALFLFFTTGAVVASTYVTDITSRLSHLLKLHHIENLRRELVSNIQTVQADLYTVYTPEGHDMDSIVRNMAVLENSARQCANACHHQPEIQSQLKEVESNVAEYEAHLSYYITAAANSDMIQRIKSDAAISGNRLLALTERMSMEASRKLGDMTTEAMVKIEKVRVIIVATLIFTFILGVWVSIRLTVSVTRPVGELLNATRIIAEGGVGHTIGYSDNTEFGGLASNFNIMSKALKESYNKLTAANHALQLQMDERIQAENALTISEAFLGNVFNSIRDPLCIVDRDYAIVRANDAYARLQKKDPPFIIGTKCYTTAFGKPEPCADCIVLRTFDTASPQWVEKYERGANGEDRWLEIYTYPFLSADGTAQYVVKHLRDITQRKMMEDEVLKARKLDSVGVLAGGLAHDFNNLLTSILGNINLARSYPSPQIKALERLNEAERAALRAQDLTQQLLTFSKGGAPVKSASSIAELVTETARFVTTGSHVRCEFDMPDDLWTCDVDAGQISRVVHNIVVNAEQAMPGGGTIRITCRNVVVGGSDSVPLAAGDYVKISIADTGVGIQPEMIGRIFDPYFSTKQKGSGLGLAASYSIVKKHDGHIAVQSVPGVGTTLDVYLPADRCAVTPVRHDEIQHSTGKGRVLVMDDEELVRGVAVEMIKQLGYDVDYATDGSEAVERYKAGMLGGSRYDVVIMDLSVPRGMGGKDAVERLREIDPNVRAIVSSGYSNDPVMAEFGKHGFSGVVAKPYRILELGRAIQRVMNVEA
ncbi:MAG: response regulator [Nitrospirae bacterium]|nr:response regulator [Nitrospirota bacterium]